MYIENLATYEKQVNDKLLPAAYVEIVVQGLDEFLFCQRERNINRTMYVFGASLLASRMIGCVVYYHYHALVAVTVSLV